MPRTVHAHFDEQQIARLAGACDLLSDQPFDSVAAIADAGQPDVIVTGWGSPMLDAEAVRLLPGLQLVAHSAGTLRHIIDPALFTQGIQATSAACANAEPVAEFSLSWILRWNKRLDTFEAAYRDTRSAYDFRNRMMDCPGNFKSTVGVISASFVGRALLRMLQPFEIECLLYDPYISGDEAATLGATKVDLPDLLGRSDVVSLNAPMLKATENMIDAAAFAAMKDGALFLNTARGGIVDHPAMIAALESGRITAVLDVTRPEPLPDDSPLWDLPNVHITPHVAGSLGHEIARMIDFCVSEIERFAAGQPLLAEVGAGNWERAA